MKFNKKAMKITAAVAGAVALGTVGAATTANADTTYTVQSGDTLSSISYKLGHNLDFVDQLAQNNNIADKNLIYVGQQLTIKDDGEVVVSDQNGQQTTVAQVQTQPAAQTTAVAQSAASQAPASTQSTYTSAVAGSDAAAKAWIAARESGGSYTAQNGQYYGKYQLSSSYLNGDYSAANQERVADNYVASRYGSWTAAQQFWQSHGWY
ncbi:LysM domain-containing protein [Limosilactobacillus mucosae]|uniref:LysM domain-containing protein n=1 Tax=Limosilactobacillus mucosae TaxID=97478 RepID=A0AAJ1M9P7_LIMMU|nr:LysM domain-containing protein [Limosilactobacillus mucosae]MDC2830652.1 LysM domain-containing protein [Limosilactobacillus mucosae]MDC2836397.1 LysM domain-containing protein [Limosilactobacillus mucosae]MDC2841751.1 LysM domain-containing protein [Limosilactobacillus mucosae]MDC2845160.1 LysM domain-containing protein [Limosilactobacillus mucosae]MDC2848411.1 LysM domain-containing protein [Limosilactobacillus mucosae]